MPPTPATSSLMKQTQHAFRIIFSLQSFSQMIDHVKINKALPFNKLIFEFWACETINNFLENVDNVKKSEYISAAVTPDEIEVLEFLSNLLVDFCIICRTSSPAGFFKQRTNTTTSKLLAISMIPIWYQRQRTKAIASGTIDTLNDNDYLSVVINIMTDYCRQPSRVNQRVMRVMTDAFFSIVQKKIYVSREQAICAKKCILNTWDLSKRIAISTMRSAAWALSIEIDTEAFNLILVQCSIYKGLVKAEDSEVDDYGVFISHLLSAIEKEYSKERSAVESCVRFHHGQLLDLVGYFQQRCNARDLVRSCVKSILVHLVPRMNNHESLLSTLCKEVKISQDKRETDSRFFCISVLLEIQSGTSETLLSSLVPQVFAGLHESSTAESSYRLLGFMIPIISKGQGANEVQSELYKLITTSSNSLDPAFIRLAITAMLDIVNTIPSTLEEYRNQQAVKIFELLQTSIPLSPRMEEVYLLCFPRVLNYCSLSGLNILQPQILQVFREIRLIITSPAKRSTIHQQLCKLKSKKLLMKLVEQSFIPENNVADISAALQALQYDGVALMTQSMLERFEKCLIDYKWVEYFDGLRAMSILLDPPYHIQIAARKIRQNMYSILNTCVKHLVVSNAPLYRAAIQCLGEYFQRSPESFTVPLARWIERSETLNPERWSNTDTAPYIAVLVSQIAVSAPNYVASIIHKIFPWYAVAVTNMNPTLLPRAIDGLINIIYYCQDDYFSGSDGDSTPHQAKKRRITQNETEQSSNELAAIQVLLEMDATLCTQMQKFKIAMLIRDLAARLSEDARAEVEQDYLKEIISFFQELPMIQGYPMDFADVTIYAHTNQAKEPVVFVIDDD